MTRFQLLGAAALNGRFRVAAVLALTWAGPIGAQAVQEIPVYPGAELVVEEEEGEKPVCCSFVTRDSYEQVLAFYEGRLKQKALDIRTLAARYPGMRARLQQMERQMPPTMRYRAFVITEVGSPGAKGAELFEVLSSPKGIAFSIPEERLGASGAQHAHAFRQKTASAGDLDGAYAEWMRGHPFAKPEDYNLPVYPGARVEQPDYAGGLSRPLGSEYKSKDCYRVYLLTPDPLDKVVGFYQGKVSGQLKPSVDSGSPGKPVGFGAIQFEIAIGESGGGTIRGKRGSMNRTVTIDRPTEQHLKVLIPAPPKFSAEERQVVGGGGTPATVIELQSEVLDPRCVEIPKARVKWDERAAPLQNMYR